MSLSGPSGPGVFLLVSGPRERGEEVGGGGGGGGGRKVPAAHLSKTIEYIRINLNETW